ncbi:MAG: LacI family DNA-binding transcriptional regulator [Propionibacteriaceae bacterium]|nr:LacI family DNA-binding transcriptional regulator [Propionibacteriaceae bacterium]
MATLEEVAHEAQVSIATASRVLNGGRKVRVENERRVLLAAEALGYKVNLAADATARGRGGGIALLAKGIADAHFSALAAGVMHAAEESDLILTMASTSGHSESTLRMLTNLRGLQPRAIIVAGSRNADDRFTDQLVAALQQYEADGGRVVMISQSGLPFDTVSVDNFSAGQDLAEALHGLGYRKFAVLAGPTNVLTAVHRVQGATSRLSELGADVPRQNIIHCPMTRDGGYAAAGEFLARDMGAEAVIAVSDAMALGALTRVREAGIALPGQLALTGFDDIVALRDVTPALTTVSLPWEQIGRRALDLALGPKGPELVDEIHQGHVVLRQTTPSLLLDAPTGALSPSR